MVIISHPYTTGGLIQHRVKIEDFHFIPPLNDQIVLAYSELKELKDTRWDEI